MASHWEKDDALTSGISEAILTIYALFPESLLRVNELLHEYHLTVSQLKILVALHHKNKSVSQLSRDLGIAKPNVTPVVDLLESRSLVVRERDTSDGRRVNIRLTDAGTDLLQQVQHSAQGQIQAWSQICNRSEAKAVRDAANTMIHFMNTICDNRK